MQTPGKDCKASTGSPDKNSREPRFLRGSEDASRGLSIWKGEEEEEDVDVIQESMGGRRSKGRVPKGRWRGLEGSYSNMERALAAQEGPDPSRGNDQGLTWDGIFLAGLILLPPVHRSVPSITLGWSDGLPLQQPSRPSNTGHLRPVLAHPRSPSHSLAPRHPLPGLARFFRSPKHHTLAVWLVHQRSYGRLIGAGQGLFGGTHPNSQSIRYL